MKKVELKAIVGGAWKIAAMQNIKEYLRANLEGTSFTVIS